MEKRRLKWGALLRTAALLGYSICTSDARRLQARRKLPVGSAGTPIHHQFIVTFNARCMKEANYDSEWLALAIAGQTSGTVDYVFDVIDGMVFTDTTLTESQILALDCVSSVKQDEIVGADVIAMAPAESLRGSDRRRLAQETSWAITDVGGGGTYTGTRRAWILDSGIDLSHPDLNINLDFAASFIANEGPDDGYGHGTHCAGLVGALDNGIGVVGVAPGAEVVPIKVLSNNGGGSWAFVLEGAEYAVQNAEPGDVINMSLSGAGSYVALENLITTAAASGIIFTLSSGNTGTLASSRTPARINGANIYTISSHDTSHTPASFNGYGPGVDFSTPGVNILSTYMGDSYQYMSGTSMSAPIAAGILLMSNGATCTAGSTSVDSHGYTEPRLVVCDGIAPVLSNCPSSKSAQATSSQGATVTFTLPTANDAQSGTVPVTCIPASGSIFNIGTSIVTCQATDGKNTGSCPSFSVTVADTLGPVLSGCPTSITSTLSTSTAGAKVGFTTPTAIDVVSGSTLVTCSPLSGSTFAVGSTAVACSTTDARGNKASCPVFTVTVNGYCGKVWDQCGGVNYTGITCCMAGLTCKVKNDWYSQCVPGA